VKRCRVDMGVSGLGRCVTGTHASTSADVHAVGFRESHMLSSVIKCARRFCTYTYDESRIVTIYF
jgi:hypothetical protein